VTAQLFDLAGHTALVTGAATEIGLTIAAALADAGARVVVNGSDVLKVEDAAQCLGVYRARTCCFDVTDEAAVVHHIDRLEKAGWPIDILVNNAGMQSRTRLLGARTVGRAVADRMIARGTGGKIINVGAAAAHCAGTDVGRYTSSEGSVGALTRSMSAEWACHDIGVNALAPGTRGTDEDGEQWVNHRSTGRWGSADDLRGPAVFLASSASDDVRGQVMYVDGSSAAGHVSCADFSSPGTFL
jgi:gluconate 5-dehydrogenase